MASYCSVCADISSSCNTNVQTETICEYPAVCTGAPGGSGGLCIPVCNQPDISGAPCGSTGCRNGLVCSVDECFAVGSLGIGDMCVSQDSNSIFCSIGLKCILSKCVNVNYPFCQSNSMCNPGEVCYNQRCMKPIGEGEPCQSSAQCQPFRNCLVNLNNIFVCTPPMSVGLGGTCFETSDCDISQNLIVS
ncbi:paramecium surface antigen repeat-containing protein [Heterostelium album PN500]|uniref:Paramecium surface antigen repeat-containing protein n=1 Tax=Heterostelium pallidum (strain ATCC 26659 / Pp 5 / PN500) TaxID=670386 RepID=D3BA11_HETP5|nr:paramecium surface antigen repeat-containing protein [Heterostelium album PN500]EFA81398.1 paramecium surface antigen repeat-containing protein [Heterostelium album PN500]|eukprot:XP_020433516.1 paramecium surface antigen repeat-containing protein [Heterostelium album PN500]